MEHMEQIDIKVDKNDLEHDLSPSSSVMDKLTQKAKTIGIKVAISDFDDLQRQYCST